MRFATIAALLFVSLQFFTCAGEEKKDFDNHGTVYKYFFQDSDMDFHFGNLVLGAAANGGVEIGEAFYAASQIKDGDAASWQQQWHELSKRVEARGDESFAAGHMESARAQWLRAANYGRLSTISLSLEDPAFRERATKARQLFRKAAALHSPAVEYIEIPFGGKVLPGYFWRAAESTKPTKTLFMVGGSETFAEDLFYYIAPQAHARGYNFVTVDLPGEGLLPLEGLSFSANPDAGMRAAVDYIIKRPEVDPQKLAAYGYTGGWLFVPRLAMDDTRLKAIAMNSAVVDAAALYSAMPKVRSTPEERRGWSSFHRGVVEGLCRRYDVPADQPGKLVDANRNNTFVPARISVPVLNIVGEGEYRSTEVQDQQKVALDGFSNARKKLIVTPINEGAGNHCILENRNLVGLVLFDWLDEVLR